jgi:hypothetical protein
MERSLYRSMSYDDDITHRNRWAEQAARGGRPAEYLTRRYCY